MLAVFDVVEAPLGDGEVRIAAAAVGLNYLDVMRCRGTYPVPSDFPMTFGVEVAGRVVEAGVAAGHLAGREVIACPTLPRGALGEHVVVDARFVTERPADIGVIDAAALPVNYQTAWFALQRGGVREGSTVLVTAGAGGVGVATIQLAASLGAVVIAAAGGPAKTAVCAEQGAATTIDYLSNELTGAVLDVTAGRGVDVIVDQVGGETFRRSLDALAFEGVMVAVGTAGGPIAPVDPMELAGRNVSIVGLSWGSTYPMRATAAVAGVYERLFELLRSGTVQPLIGSVVRLAETGEALAALADRRTVGKAVVEIGSWSGDAATP